MIRFWMLIFPAFLLTSALFGQALCNGSPQPNSPCAGWQALQQLRSLIPERIWEQDFDVIVDEVAFRKVLPEWLHKEGRRPVYTLAHSTRFFLQSTLSGEQVRIIDRYQEFQGSPYWITPVNQEKLNEAIAKLLKEKPNP